MAINQLQYMSVSLPVINYDDVRARLLNSAKDEDISPFTAVDKYFKIFSYLFLNCCLFIIVMPIYLFAIFSIFINKK